MNGRVRAALGIVAALAVLWFLRAPADGAEFQVCLGRGYYLTQEPDGGGQSLRRRDARFDGASRLFAGRIDRWGRAGSLVVGELNGGTTSASRPGYFVLDTASGEFAAGLSQVEYLRDVHARGEMPPDLDELRWSQQFSLQCLRPGDGAE